MKISFIYSFLLLLPVLPATSQAETRYISDQLLVTVRSSTGQNYKVLEKLKTDTPVEVLKDDGTFVKVKTEKGNSGYIRREFVSKNTPKPIRIAELTKQAEQLQAQLDKERLECQDGLEMASSSQARIDTLDKDLQSTRDELEKVTADYTRLREKSKDVLNLMTAYEEQSEENYRLNSELEVLQDENKNFHRSNSIQWFLAGGSVFLTGWLVGKVSRRKRGFSRL